MQTYFYSGLMKTLTQKIWYCLTISADLVYRWGGLNMEIKKRKK